MDTARASSALTEPSRQGPSALPKPSGTSIPTFERAISALFAVAILVVLVVASTLEASPDGHGTHTQLGLDECGFVAAFGKPCATCGMTTAFAHAADFSLLRSVMAQPAGAVFAISSSVAFWILVYVAGTGSSAGRMIAYALGRKLLWTGLILLGLAWLYKVVAWSPGM